MYQIGQCIVYRNVGVCRVEAIGKLGFTSDKDKEYYTLQPLNSNGNAKIYVPVDKDTFMLLCTMIFYARLKNVPL